MIVRGTLITLCLAALGIGTVAGCTPPAGDNGGSSGYQANPADDLGNPASNQQGADPNPAAPGGQLEDEAGLPDFSGQALPGTTTAFPDIPSFDEQAPFGTTTPLPEIPSTDEQAPPETTTPEPDTPASDG